MRLALDTNVLAYAEGINGATMQSSALDVISRLPAHESFLPVQVLGELFNLLIRKGDGPRLKPNRHYKFGRTPSCLSKLRER